ncbi:hypothetical protein [Desulfovibrio falkowii]|uniref:Uncharacterized protein n=1 Tax=Desulfovibrio falkowii TaxID=3136602 RepID=A0ABQ0E9S6_9BACT
MELTLTDSDLARLEGLIAHNNLGGSTAMQHLPALVAEVRRLRAALAAQHDEWRIAAVRADELEEENEILRVQLAEQEDDLE